jgi:4-coumarate--CoA ligase (photoactive yellow protein activation family)
VLAAVPAHHLYGFMWTVLVPRALGASVVDVMGCGPGGVARAIEQGGGGENVLVVGHPGWLAGVLAQAPGLGGATVVSSAGRLGEAVWGDLAEAGAGRVIEVYGSTETGAVGWREAGGAAFALMGQWKRGEGAGGVEVRRMDGRAGEIQDVLEWQGEGAFVVGGRRDGAVKVGGVNVFPEKVAGVLRAVEGVVEVAVRGMSVGEGAGGVRLKAFVAVAAGEEVERVEARVRAAAGQLAAAERPVHWTFGTEVPRNEMGKVVDWGGGVAWHMVKETNGQMVK